MDICECGHTFWEHTVDEILHEDGDESLIANECKHCSCVAFVISKEKSHPCVTITRTK